MKTERKCKNSHKKRKTNYEKKKNQKKNFLPQLYRPAAELHQVMATSAANQRQLYESEI